MAGGGGGGGSGLIRQVVFGAGEDFFSPFPESTAAAGDLRQPSVFCPKPRRLVQLVDGGAAAAAGRILWLQASHPADIIYPKAAAADQLDFFLAKGLENNNNNQVAGGVVAHTPPPFFVGSPPARSANPVVYDSRFGEACPAWPVAPSATTPPPQLPSPIKFGFKPAAVRVEGFDSRLDRRDRPSRSITAFA